MIAKLEYPGEKNVNVKTTPAITSLPIKVCIVGVFNIQWSSSIKFSEAFKKNPNVSQVTEFDYRESLKKSFGQTGGILTKLARTHDLIIIMKGNGIPLQAVRSASKYCVIYHWFQDWYPMFKSHRNILDICVFSHYRSATGYATADLWSKSIKLPVYHVLDGVDPLSYQPVATEKIYDISFIGSKDSERDSIYSFLKNNRYNVSFNGPGFTSFVKPDEFINICSSSKLVLNISRGNYEGYSSRRLWMVLACGSPVITKKVIGMEKHYNLINKKQIVEFDSLIDLKNKINYYLANPEECKKIGDAGRKYVLDNRTWDHTVNDILNVVTTEPGQIYPENLDSAFIKKIKDGLGTTSPKNNKTRSTNRVTIKKENPIPDGSKKVIPKYASSKYRKLRRFKFVNR